MSCGTNSCVVGLAKKCYGYLAIFESTETPGVYQIST